MCYFGADDYGIIVASVVASLQTLLFGELVVTLIVTVLCIRLSHFVIRRKEKPPAEREQ